MFSNKCKTCDSKINIASSATIRLNTVDGVIELEICGACAEFFDSSAEVIMKGRRDETK